MARSIVIVDEEWVCFQQLALALQRAGANVHLVSIAPGVGNRLRQRALYPRSYAVGDAFGMVNRSHLAAVLQDIGPADIADIVCSEDTLLGVTDAARDVAVADPALADLERRCAWLDKHTSAQLLAASGLRVPASLEADTPVGEALERLGSPLFVKQRHGAGGDGVVLAGTPAEITRAMARLSRTPGDLYFEQRIEGLNCRYVAAYRGDEIIHDACYVADRVDPNSLGPPTGARLVDNAELSETGRAVLRRVGGRGLANVETMEDDAGRQWIIDLNLRPWGTCMALSRAGFDFAGAYLAALGLADAPPVVPPTHSTVAVFPTSSRELARHDPAGGVRHFVGELGPSRRLFGTLYAGDAAVSFGIHTGRQVAKRALGRVRALRRDPRPGGHGPA